MGKVSCAHQDLTPTGIVLRMLVLVCMLVVVQHAACCSYRHACADIKVLISAMMARFKKVCTLHVNARVKVGCCITAIWLFQPN